MIRPPPSFPPVPSGLPRLEGPGGLLARAEPASSRPFSLTGRRAIAHGTGLRGLAAVRVGPWSFSGVRTGLAPASGVVLGPSSVRREAVGGGGTVLETLLVPSALAAAALQWTRPAGAEAPLTLELEWTVAREGVGRLVHGASGDGAWTAPAAESEERGGDGAAAPGSAGAALPEDDAAAPGDAGGAADPLALMVLRPTPVSWEVRAEGAALRVSARLRPAPGEPVTLLIAAGETEAEAGAALRAVANLRAQERRLEQAADDAREEGLALRTGVGELDEALEWAKARLRGAVAEHAGRRWLRPSGAACAEGDPAAGDASPAIWTAIGGLAAGEIEPARLLLEDGAAGAHLLWLLGRYVLWTGDAGPLLARRGAIAEWLASPERSTDAAEPVFARIAAAELADACEGAGERALAEALRSGAGGRGERQAERADERADRAGGRTDPAERHTEPAPGRLPMLGRDRSPAAENPDALVAGLGGALDGAPYVAPAAPPTTSVSRALRAWALCRAGDPEAGYLLLREHLAAGLAGGAGMWPELADGGGCLDHTASAALGPAAVLFGLLGAGADAAVGRLHLAPRLPAAWKSFEVSGIRVADAAVTLRYRREGHEHAFTAEQPAGRIPVMLVLEPQIAAEVDRVLVDGAPAELDRFRRGGRTGVRVQLPLERQRTVTLVSAGRPA